MSLQASWDWDYIVVGGGLAGSVIASRLLKYNEPSRILVIEAGPDASSREDILYYQSLDFFGGEFDWNYKSVPQKNFDGRQLDIAAGRVVGGGSVINGCGWFRGARADFDHWSEVVGDSRWSYEGQLPYFKMTENWYKTRPSAHGTDGSLYIESPSSTGRIYPLADTIKQSWHEAGVEALPDDDMNAGDNIGLGELNENRHNGTRQIANLAYSLKGVTLLTDTLVESILLNKAAYGTKATGVRLANGTEYHAKEIIASAGAFRTPQLLILSGIGPAALLKHHGIDVNVDIPEVGQGLSDHIMLHLNWKLRDPSLGYALGSENPIFRESRFATGTPISYVASTTMPEDGLKAAIAKDECTDEVHPTHYLLKRRYAMMENLVMHMAVPPQPMDGKHISTALMAMKPTSRGNVSISSKNPADPPVIDPKYFDTEVDKYVWRTGLRDITSLMSGNSTTLGREIVEGETPPEGFTPLSAAATDEYLDARVKAAGITTNHGSGTCAMGKVVDTELRVKGIQNLRVVDASVLPVVIGAHIQSAVYSLAEQAAVLISEASKPRSS